ncbi:hypothetical protein IEE91_04445 [Kocuria sp. cx-455]|uniref:hypothetical protein n=1 Tax=Kocuria sp. cx-455 TaxID=2771377 RepID=UPI00168666F3|nr:hypothetical protein [Kocuria sp. cx-455]MBD2764458.1 hypothetical protein [Kocuria sp. cx-455]
MAIPTTIFATRQWGTRRAHLAVEVYANPLLPVDARSGLLEVTYRDIPVEEPHLVSVTLRNVGPRDVATKMFDGGRSITVKFDHTFYGITATQGDFEITSPGIGAKEGAIVSMSPGLLKRGESWSFSAVTSGPVDVTVDTPLIDTDVRAVERAEDSSSMITLKVSAFGVTAEIPLRRGA